MARRKSAAMRAIEARQREYARQRRKAERDMGRLAKENTYKFGTGEVGANDYHTAPVHGTTEDGPVTAAFGLPEKNREGQTYLADGYANDYGEFWKDSDGIKQHDDYDGHGGGTQRDKYTGYGSK